MTADNIRVELSGDGGEVLLRRRAEALDALQQIVNTAFRRELKDDRSFVVDCMDYRKAKDAELRQMARFMMDKAKMAGPQEMGPLNPYARRLVHLTVAEDPQMSSESIGDAFLEDRYYFGKEDERRRRDGFGLSGRLRAVGGHERNKPQAGLIVAA